MGIVYLICDAAKDLFKIGITKGKIKKRLSELQTGNGSELHLVKSYQSNYYKFIEKGLHNKFFTKREEGEWFKLEINDIINFGQYCGMIEDMAISLEDNPFINV